MTKIRFEELTAYEMRGGGKATVLRVLDSGSLLVWREESKTNFEYFPDGSYISGKEHHKDLVRPWRDNKATNNMPEVLWCSTSSPPEYEQIFEENMEDLLS